MRADRLVAMVLLLQNKGRLTAAAIAKELAVSKRTVLRDIDALSLSGIPVWAEGGHRGGVSLDEGYRTSLTGLKENELKALFVGGSAALLADIGMGGEVKSGELKLAASIPDRFRSSVEFVQNRILIDPRWWWHEKQNAPFLDILQRAVLSDAVVETEYEHFDGSRDLKTLKPYGLVAKSGLWYVVADDGRNFHSYRASRFYKAELTGKSFARDPAFDLRVWWPENAKRFAAVFTEYHCVLEIPEQSLRYVQWLAPGRSEVLETLASGSRLRVRVGLESEETARLLVFGLGAGCSIVEPESLLASVLDKASAIIAAHIVRRP